MTHMNDAKQQPVQQLKKTFRRVITAPNDNEALLNMRYTRCSLSMEDTVGSGYYGEALRRDAFRVGDEP